MSERSTTRAAYLVEYMRKAGADPLHPSFQALAYLKGQVSNSLVVPSDTE